MKKSELTLRLPCEYYKELKKISLQTGFPVANLICQIVLKNKQYLIEPQQ